MIASKRFEGLRARLLGVALTAAAGLPVTSALAQGLTVRATTSGVEVASSDLSKTLPATKGMPIVEGSELTGSSGDHAQLECASGVSYTLVGPFDVVVDSKDAKRLRNPEDPKGSGVLCTVDLKSGTAVATTGIGDGPGSDTGTAVIIGPDAVAMVSHHTQFGLSVSQQGASGIESAFVFDGAAVLTRKDSPRDVQAGSSVDPETNSTTSIDDDTYQSIADTYTDLDLSEGSAQSSQGYGFELQQSWFDALKHFDDPLARVRLAETQAAAGATQSVIFYYELKRAGQLADASGNKELISRVQSLRKKFGDRLPKAGPASPNAPHLSVS